MSSVARPRRARVRAGLAVAATTGALLAVTLIAARAREPTATAADGPVTGGVCLSQSTPDQLDHLFDSEPGGVIGADYQRTTPLPDGNVLWTFQDAEVRLPDGSSTLVHNIGMLQRGNCFTVHMSGTPADPEPWLFAAQTTKYSHWYWPLGAEVGTDGRVYVFVAEMFETAPGYLTRAEPVSTAVAVIDGESLVVESIGVPGDSSVQLYGFSIESDTTWTYLYAQCHRQFGFDPYIDVYAHDFRCANRVTVARVPKGRLLDAPSYWTGAGWRTDPSLAVPVIETTGRMVNATQVVRSNNHWMAITKVGDWWGDRILIEQSERAVGPFRVVADIAALPKCVTDCNTYFASWVPSPDPGRLLYGLSHNRWDGVASLVYRPTFGSVPAPAYAMSPADRCALGYCN